MSVAGSRTPQRPIGRVQRINGCNAVAQAVKLCEVDVVASYPIRPYTGIMTEIARLVNNGELEAEFLMGGGEHDQLSIALGASAAGARAFCGSSGVGVTYAGEMYAPISGGRTPLQMVVANRTLDPPGDFGSEHTEALSTRDMGWMLGWASHAQECLDNTIFAYRVGEDPRVLLPQMTAMDGYFVSHIQGDVAIPPIEAVREFLPPYRHPHPLDPARPVSHGPQIHPERGAAMQVQRANGMEILKLAIYEHIDAFNRIFGRSYHPFIETYMLEDAEIVYYVQGAFAETAKIAIRKLRKEGVKIGLLRPRWIRPFPEEEIANALQDAKVVGVVETNLSLGAPTNGGSLALDLCSALYHLDRRPLQLSFMAGMGGETITPQEFLWMAEVMERTKKTGRVEKRTWWAGFDH